MMWCAVATVTFVASNMMLLIVHVKMIAAPLVLRLQTAAFSLRFCGDDVEPEAAATTRDPDWHLANGTKLSGATSPCEVVFILREPQPIHEFMN